MVTYNEALQIIKKEFQNISLNSEEVDILDSTNRVLAEDVIADIDLPPFNNSAVDGYAIKFSERKSWKIIGEISAGNYTSSLLNKIGQIYSFGGNIFGLRFMDCLFD